MYQSLELHVHFLMLCQVMLCYHHHAMLFQAMIFHAMLSSPYSSLYTLYYAAAIIARDVVEQVRETFGFEWERAHVVKRTFTDFGFNKGMLRGEVMR